MTNLSKSTAAKAAAFAAATILFFAFTLYLSSIKPIRFDETFTYHISRLSSPIEIWVRMAQGIGETNPPYLHMLTHYVQKLPVSNELGIRILPMIGYWVMVCGVFCFARRRVSLAVALTAAAVSLCAIYYAVEGRAYGVMLGCAGLALPLWQRMTESAKPLRYVLPLGLCFALATSVHFYGFLIMLPFVTGELVRSRRIASLMPMGIACLIGIAPLGTMLPFIAYSRTWLETWWGAPTWRSSWNAYLSISHAPLLASLVAAVVFTWGLTYKQSDSQTDCHSFLLHEKIVILCFAAMPLIIHVLALYTKSYSGRYVLYVIPGIALVSAWVLGTLRTAKAAYIVLVACLLNGVMVSLHKQINFVYEQNDFIFSMVNNVEQVMKDHPEYEFAYKNSALTANCVRLQHYLKERSGRTIHCFEGPVAPYIKRCLQAISPLNPVDFINPEHFTNGADVYPLPGHPDILVRTAPLVSRPAQ